MTTKQDKTSRFVMCLILPPSSEQIPSPTICPCSYFTLVMWNPVGLAPISTNVTELQGKSHGVLADAFKTWRGTEKTQNTAGGRGSEQKHRPAFPLKTLLQLTLLDMGIVEFSSSPLNNMQIESRKMDLGGAVLLTTKGTGEYYKNISWECSLVGNDPNARLFVNITIGSGENVPQWATAGARQGDEDLWRTCTCCQRWWWVGSADHVLYVTK